MLDKYSIGKSFDKENVTLFNGVNFGSGSDRDFCKHLSLL